MEQRLLQCLQKCKTIKQFKQTHLQTIVNGLKDSTFIVPRLITLSTDLISLDYANQVLQTSLNPNVIAYNTFIKCSMEKLNTPGKAAFLTYNQMRFSNIQPNSFTFTFLLRCFGSLRDGEMLHGHVVKLGFDSIVFVLNTLLDFYAKHGGKLELVVRLFDEMPDRDVVSWNTVVAAYMSYGEVEHAVGLFESMPQRNVVTWNTVITGLSKAGNMDLACSIFRRMPERNEVSWNTMVSGYIKVGDMSAARAIFCEMPVKSVVSWTAMVSGYAMVGDLKSARTAFDLMPVKNVVSWNAMIAGYVNSHMFNEALSVFHHMLMDGKCRPDQTTLISVLSACAHLGSHEHGRWISSYIKKNKLELSISLGNALIDMFAKCGDVENATAVFCNMDGKCVITWTTMILGLAVNGLCREALEVFDRMCLESIQPDDVVFIAVLSACTHGGLVEEGKRVFDQMRRDFDIEPRIDHYGCMVDLLGRAGRFQEAVRFIENMHLEPNAVIWATLLSACKIHGNEELLESLTRKILDQEPSNPSYLTLVTNLSSSVGRWQEALNFRLATRFYGLEKVPGCSSIQVGNCVHEFLAKDTRHAERKQIYDVLGTINAHLRMVCESLYQGS